MEAQDKTTFSLDDEEIVEEEVIERDEEYDDGSEDDYDDYDDYDEEEDYDDYEEEPEEEDYDDGYSDDYYDDRLNKVLDEIAELKRGMVPATQQQPQPPIMPPPMPQYIYQPSVPSAGSEVVMYNEISRLRDELAKNQSSLEMQKELARIKEDMARDQRYAEAQYSAEIKRLQDKIEDLLKNADGPQGELPYTETARIEGGKSLDFDRLLNINEAILRNSKDGDARIQNEIAQLKRQLEAVPSLDELNRAVAAVKKAASGMDSIGADTISKLSADIAALKTAVEAKGIAPTAQASAVSVTVKDAGGDIAASELLRQLYELKNVVGSTSSATVARTQTVLDFIGEYKKVGYDVHSQTTSFKDKLQAVYALAKKLDESGESEVVDLMSALDDMVAELADTALNRAVFADLAAYYAEKGASTVTLGMRDSAERFFNLCERLNGAQVSEYGNYLPDIVAELNKLENNRKETDNREKLAKVTEALTAVPQDEGKVKACVAELVSVKVSDVVELDRINAPKSYTPARSVSEDSIFSKLDEIKAIIIENAQKAAAAPTEDTAVTPTENTEAVNAENSENAEDSGISASEAQALRAALDEILARIDGLKVANADAAPTEAQAVTYVPNGEYDAQQIAQLQQSLEELKAKLENATQTEGLADALEELRSNYLEISERLVNISERISAAPVASETVATEVVRDSADMSATLDDLQYIRAKLEEYDGFITKFDELHNDIAGISGDANVAEQLNTALSELNTQFDKLYEDLSNVLIESEANILGKLNETGVAEAVGGAKAEIIAETQAVKDGVSAVADAIELVKSDLLAETQIIKDSILMVTDAVAATPVADAVEQLRADVAALTDTAINNADAATLDRQKLLDDIAFLREQAELALAEGDEQFVEMSDDGDSEQYRQNIYGYLDDITAKINALSAVPEDVVAARDAATAVSDSVAVILDTVTPISENINAVNENIATVAANAAETLETVRPLKDDITAARDAANTAAENVAAITDGINAVNDGMATVAANSTEILDAVLPLKDDVATTRDAANAALDALAPISDRLNAILDRLDSEPIYDVNDETGDVDSVAPQAAMSDEELVELKDGLNTILDTLPLFPQADDVVTTRDNTYSILDALAMMPQADDIIVTRDNVAAMLDAVNELASEIKAIADGSNGNATEDIAAVRADTSAILAALPQTLAEDLATVRDNTGAALDSLAALTQSQEEISAISESVNYIRTRMEESKVEEQNDDLANIMQDLGLVLDKLEEYEQNSLNNKQEIIDAVTGIREEIHINELDETITAAGIDDETRDTLVTEISDIRERLSNIEGTTQAINDTNGALADITNQLVELKAALDGGTAEGTVTADGAVLQTLDDINEKLNAIESGALTATVSPETMDAIVNDLADIKAAIAEGGIAADGAPAAISDEALQAIVDELSVIREKLDADPVYDTVEEILSLREDVKAARIVDQNEVSGELESIKNELASIASGNILDEIRALRDDIAAIGGGVETGATAAPTDDELNLVLNEIVSLRDEVFSFKDEVLNATAIAPESEAERAETPSGIEDISLILDEITALRADQSVLGENIDELKDAISRRTTISTAETDGGAQDGNVASDELNIVLDEIINLKNDIDALSAQTQSERLDLITEQIEEIRAMLDGGESEAADAASVDATTLSEQLDGINGTLNELLNRHVTENGEAVALDDGAIMSRFDELHAEIDEIKSVVGAVAPQQDFAAELAELREELNAVRAENERLKQESSDAVASQLAELRDAIRDMTLVAAAPTTVDGDTSYAALIDEIRGLREQVAATQAPTAALDAETLESIRDAVAINDNTGYAAELGEIRDEIAQLRSLTTISAESGGSMELAAMRDELAELKAMLSSPDSLYGVAEDVSAIKADVQTLKEEPDLGVMSEIMALRDEFQALREEIADVKRIAGETEKESDESLMTEIQSLRDQLFAISMANVNDTASGETNYESYNNIILDELSALRDRIEAVPTTDTEGFADELAQLRETIDGREGLYDALAARVAKLDTDATNNKILEELSSLRTEISNQREADLTTLNFMSEMAHLLERQNQYLTENADSKITDEIESLKAEIASTDAVAEEVAKLREIMTQAGNASDNETILGELADLREELSREKPTQENTLILDAIARLRDEITELAATEKRRDELSDEDLNDSLSDLKNQLNEIAGIVEPEKKQPQPAPAKRKSPGRPAGSKNGTGKSKSATSKSTSSKSSSSKSGAKKSTSAKLSSKSGTSAAKSSTGAKRGRKPAQKPAQPVAEQASVDMLTEERPSVQTVDFDSLIDRQASMIGGDSEFSLNAQAVTTTQTTVDALDVADKLAKQVANKLIMEQLVEQLGDGGVSDERVDEILREILPQEFTTVAMTEQSDKVRRLANQLVLNKLRDRLRGIGEDEDNDE